MRVEGLMRLSFLPAKQLHEARTRGLLTHLHKKLPQLWKKLSGSDLFIWCFFSIFSSHKGNFRCESSSDSGSGSAQELTGA